MAVRKMIRLVPEDDFQVTIDEAFDRFIEDKEAHGRAEKTLQGYCETYRRFIEVMGFEPYDESIDIITKKSVNDFINKLRKTDISNNSINRYIREIRAWLYFCMEERLIQPPYSIEQVKVQEALPKTFKDGDLEKLLVKPKRKSSFCEWRTWVIVNFMLGTGARPATVVNLKYRDIHFTKKEIVFTHTKTKKAQIVPLDNELAKILRNYCTMFNRKKDDWVFPSITDEQLSTKALWRAFNKFCDDREVENTKIYGLRHSFASGWIRNGGNPMALKDVMGHSSITTTQKYVRLYGEDLKKDYEDYSMLSSIKKNKSRANLIDRNE